MDYIKEWYKSKKLWLLVGVLVLALAFLSTLVDGKEPNEPTVRNEPLSQHMQRDCYVDKSIANKSLEELEAMYRERSSNLVRCENYFTIYGKDKDGRDSDVVIYKGSYQ